MEQIAVVSVDLFQTLVNVDTRCHPFWRQVLGVVYTPEQADTYWGQLKAFLYREYRELFVSPCPFVSARTVAERSFAKLFSHLGLHLDPVGAVQIFIQEHHAAVPFDDAVPFLEAVGRCFPLCLVSDADEEMIGPHRHLHAFDRIFTSEEAGAYKNSPTGGLFRSVVEHYGMEAGQIIHIGDSPFDVLGAARAGLVSCWLNRPGRPWEQQIRPRYVVGSLQEAAALLGVTFT